METHNSKRSNAPPIAYQMSTASNIYDLSVPNKMKCKHQRQVRSRSTSVCIFVLSLFFRDGLVSFIILHLAKNRIGLLLKIETNDEISKCIF